MPAGAIMNIETVKKRSEIICGIREFFTGNGYLEVETPILSPFLIPEINIEVFGSEFVDPYKGNTPLYLTPSPEIWMKKILAEGYGSIFQICKSFRNCEQKGRIHNPEFTMLEWYTKDADYMDSIKTAEDLFAELYHFNPVKSLAPPFRRMSMEEAFAEFAGFDLASAISSESLFDKADSAGLSPNPDEDGEALFNRIFVSIVEPELPRNRPLILYDYPALVPALSKRIPETPWTERWELYAGGMELANCYSEETDPEIIRRFFEIEGKLKTAARIPHKTDPDYHRIFSPDYPVCSGAALGVDRIVMLFTEIESIDGVIFFPFSDMMP